ncbi:DUF6701 domain-containing protein [Methylobacillus flagellatus]|uniref:DUF6701 domain-containing protein n=1 Tax=Methylobacillus flagellatus TaxID=405 RepID=UPI0010F9CB46|nr:DUF6701 domain-containing protein [Methylobacillus flagellatus]
MRRSRISVDSMRRSRISVGSMRRSRIRGDGMKCLLGRALLILSLLGLALPAQALVGARASSTASSVASGVTFVGNGTPVVGSIGIPLLGIGSLTPPLPGGIQTGDLLVCMIESHDDYAHAISASTPGWTTRYSLSFPGGILGLLAPPHRASMFFKIATSAAEPAPVILRGGVLSLLSLNSAVARCSAFRGVDTSTPFDIASASAGDDSADLTIETGTTASNVTRDTMLLLSAHLNNDPATTSVTTAGGLSWTQAHHTTVNALLDLGLALDDAMISLFYAQKSPTAAVGPLVVSANAQTGISHGVLSSLRPAPAVLTLNRPAGTQSGDVLLATLAVTKDYLTITPPSGWSLVRQVTQSAGNASQLYTYLRVAGGSEPVSYNWTFSGGAHVGLVGSLSALTGVDVTAPVVDTEAGTATVSDVSHTAPSVSASRASHALFTAHAYSSAGSWTAPAGMTELTDVASTTLGSSSGISLSTHVESRFLLGASGTRTATASAAADTGAAQSIILRSASLFDHIRIEHDGSALTCAAEPVVVKACADPACTTLYTSGTVTGNLIWTGVPNGIIPFTINPSLPGSGQTVVNVSVTTVQAIILGSSNVFPLPGNVGDCLNISNGSASCQLQFTNTGFLFSTIPNQIAGINSASITMQAVRTDNNTGVCSTLFSGNRVVEMAAQCMNPTTCAGQAVSINGVPIAGSPASSIAGYTAVSLSFGANSTASFIQRYPDVGSIRLSARYALEPGVFVSGGSNNYVVRPYDLRIVDIAATASAAANPGAASASGPAFVAAGDGSTAASQFSLSVAAAAYSDNAPGYTVAPNFGRELVPEGVLLSHALIADADLVNPGTLFNASLPGSSFIGGVVRPTNLGWNEVGIMQLVAGIADGDYLGAGPAALATPSGNIGRFYPAGFRRLSSDVTPACSAVADFTYMGQGFNVAATLQAVAAGSSQSVTQNYRGAYAKGQVLLAAEHADNGIDLSSRLTVPTSSWLAGVYTLNGTAQFARPLSASPDASWGPYDNLLLGVRVADSDGAVLDGLNMNPATAATCSTCNHQLLDSTPMRMRLGRLRLQNAYGSELLPLPVPLEAQYWNGSLYATNTLDSCTTLAASQVAMGNYQGSLAACETSVSTAGLLQSGRINLTLSRPGPGNGGSVDLSLNAGAAASGNSCVAGAATTATAAGFSWFGVNPGARATFGLRRSPLIYLRENF